MGTFGCLCEKCWKGYEKKGMKKMFGKMYPNCVKKESMTEDGHTDVASAKRAMKVIAEDAIDMFKTLKSMNDEGSLPSWWMNKIAISKTYMNNARDYMKNPNESVNEGSARGAAVYINTFEKLLKKQMGSKFSNSSPTQKDIQRVLGLMRKRYNESINEISGVDVAKKVLKNKQHEKGIDLQTANLIVTIDKAYNKNPRLQKKFRAIQLPKMKQLILKYFK
tara:strand:+ start:154 stop:816 length:663 start_codon:yes stop_codon:yes gene_type:complete